MSVSSCILTASTATHDFELVYLSCIILDIARWESVAILCAAFHPIAIPKISVSMVVALFLRYHVSIVVEATVLPSLLLPSAYSAPAKPSATVTLSVLNYFDQHLTLEVLRPRQTFLRLTPGKLGTPLLSTVSSLSQALLLVPMMCRELLLRMLESRGSGSARFEPYLSVSPSSQCSKLLLPSASCTLVFPSIMLHP